MRDKELRAEFIKLVKDLNYMALDYGHRIELGGLGSYGAGSRINDLINKVYALENGLDVLAEYLGLEIYSPDCPKLAVRKTKTSGTKAK